MDLKEAAEIAIGLASVKEEEMVELASSTGRVLAADIAAGRDYPGEYRSRWDGFALSSMDVSGASHRAPVLLDIVAGRVAAGDMPEEANAGGKSFRIMTGAVLPGGTDAVIPFEDASVVSDRLAITVPVAEKQGTVTPGAEALAGEILLRRGDVLTPTRMAMAAAIGLGKVPVHKRPRVAILATGNELREAGKNSSDSEGVFCNNLPLLLALSECCGAESLPLGIAPDDPDTIFARLVQTRADLIVTTGGTGSGAMDFIPEVWERLGVQVHFDSLNISPGKGSMLGSTGSRIFLGLPGNPWAAQMMFEEIAAPLLRRMQGARIWNRCSMAARTSASIFKRPGFYRAVRGSLGRTAEKAVFIPIDTGPRLCHLPLLRSASAYVVLDPETTCVREGEEVVVKIPDLSLSGWASLSE